MMMHNCNRHTFSILEFPTNVTKSTPIYQIHCTYVGLLPHINSHPDPTTMSQHPDSPPQRIISWARLGNTMMTVACIQVASHAIPYSLGQITEMKIAVLAASYTTVVGHLPGTADKCKFSPAGKFHRTETGSPGERNIQMHHPVR